MTNICSGDIIPDVQNRCSPERPETGEEIEEMNRRKLSIIGIAAAAVLAAVIIIGFTVRGSAVSQVSMKEDAVYRSYRVTSNDTLWSISEEYASSCGLEIRDYIRELKTINRLQSDRITDGMNLIIVTCPE